MYTFHRAVALSILLFCLGINQQSDSSCWYDDGVWAWSSQGPGPCQGQCGNWLAYICCSGPSDIDGLTNSANVQVNVSVWVWGSCTQGNPKVSCSGTGTSFVQCNPDHSDPISTFVSTITECTIFGAECTT